MEAAHPASSLPHPLSAVRFERAWFVACETRELDTLPIARTIQGLPVVLFRSRGLAVAALDRCPHRNAPLSAGRVLASGNLECRYHGWQFDGEGRCRAIPGLDGAMIGEPRSRDATTLAVREQDGFVWVASSAGREPSGEPWRVPHLDDRRYGIVRRRFDVRATLHATAENALDVPHTAFLHAGLFRTPARRQPIDVVVRRTAERVEAEYLGEPRPTGLAPRLLAPRGGVVTHVDRFILPSIVQVEYRLGDRMHLVSSAALTPIDELTTRLHAVVALRTPLPRALVRLAAVPVMQRIFRQDAEMLALQSGTIRAFGGERFAHSPVDVLGPQIWRLLRRAAAAGEAPAADAEREFRVRMLV